MCVNRILPLLLLLTGWVPGLYLLAQQSLTDRGEELLSGDEGVRIPMGELEERYDMQKMPVNLNKATARELETTGLFTSFQVKMLIDYRERYGKLLSIYELASLTGFRVQHLREISRYLTVDNTGISIPLPKPEHQAILYAGRIFPASVGYSTGSNLLRQPVYPGSPVKTSLKMKTGAGRRITMGMAYEKDAGETGLIDHKPQYMTGYLHYRDHRLIEQIIAGHYRLHMGLGLVCGSGLFQTPGETGSPPLCVLKPYAGLTESRIHRGLACRLRLSPFKLLLWGSLQPLDLSLSNLESSQDHTDWASLSRKTGLYRTSGERNGRNLGFLANSGIQARYNRNGLFLGTYLAMELTGLTTKGRDSLKTDNKRSTYHTFGMHWRWNRGKMHAYGEFASGFRGSMAFLTGLQYHVSSFLSGSLILHHYGVDHRETYSAAYSSGSHTSNENGLAVTLHAEPYRNVVTDLSVEWFGYPSPRYLAQVPSCGYRSALTLQGTWNEKTEWRIRITRKGWHQTPEGDLSGIRRVVQNQLTRVDTRLVYHPGKALVWQTRLVAAVHRENKTGYGLAAVQQIRIVPRTWIRCTLQFVVFNVENWENRICIYEPGLYHQFNFPLVYGQGQKTVLVISVKPFRQITLEGRGAVVSYLDRDSIGSGNDLVEGSRKYHAEIQLRCSF